jgi:ElaB/YqjD/DUF883 family membrane-anchored ribosome-binding protein
MAAATEQDASLSELEREAELSRAKLANTVGALHDRVTPDAIKEDVRGYIQERGQDFYRKIERNARENPLQTAAIAAGVAYPLWRLVSSIPVPILLVGAGLALSRGAGRDAVAHVQSRIQDAVDDTTHSLRRQFHDATDAVSRTVDTVRDHISSRTDQAGSSLQDANSSLSAGAQKLASDATRRGAEAVASARQAGSDALDATSQRLSSAYDAGVDAVSRTGDQMVDFSVRSKDRFVEMIEQHPIIVGSIGLAVGALIASSLPSTRIENRAFGAGSDELRARAAGMANQAVDSVKSAAGEVYDTVAREAEQRGLTPDALKDAGKELGNNLASVADRAVGKAEAKGMSTGQAEQRGPGAGNSLSSKQTS